METGVTTHVTSYTVTNTISTVRNKDSNKKKRAFLVVDFNISVLVEITCMFF